MILEIVNLPSVRVPVLSNIIVSILLAVSSVSLVFTSIPCFAHKPSPTTIASGVARPRAHGHATTRIDTNVFIESLNE